MQRLPEKMSDLINVAVDDLIKVENDSRYTVDMDCWHIPNLYGNGQCAVCLGGSVMAMTLDMPINERLDPYDTNSKWNTVCLKALDDIRQGCVRDAYEKMHPFADDVPEGFPQDFEVDPYFEDPETFKITMRAIALRLADIGL